MTSWATTKGMRRRARVFAKGKGPLSHIDMAMFGDRLLRELEACIADGRVEPSWLIEKALEGRLLQSVQELMNEQ